MDNDSFFSIDRLVDFGLGIGIAQQMVNVMNKQMQQMYIPGSILSMPAPKLQTIYYVAIENKQVGPLNDSELSQFISQKMVTKDTQAWMPGMPTWQPIENIPEILKLVALIPPQLPTDNQK